IILDFTMHILIAYSSGYGATREVSEEIAKILLEEPSFRVDVNSIDRVDVIEGYDTVVIGSSVRADKAMANVRDFIGAHRFELTQKKLALFLVCLTANCKEGRDKVLKDYMPPILEKYPHIHPISSEAFGGKIDFDRLNPVMQSLMKRVLEKTGVPTQGSVDTRDWEYIRSWAKQLKNLLLSKEEKQS
ncbi:hypothetical protein JXO59_05080, partial [candidate division KSB1 bacterium]|nr:hypothetical protein [candidate division KSB1 bacterium]